MIFARSPRPFLPLVLAALALAAVLGRAWLPVGYMPDARRPGALVICTGHAGTPGRSDNHRPAPTCPFAAASTPAEPPPTAALASPPVLQAIPPSGPSRFAWAPEGFSWRRPPSTGPPVRA